MADAAFSLFVAVLALVVTVLATVKGVWAAGAVFGILVVGFLFRAGYSYKRGSR
jgi:hypothetical protein